MNQAIENYIEQANFAIKLVPIKGIIEDNAKLQEKKMALKKELGLQEVFLIGSDAPQNDEDLAILENVLKIDERIVYITDDINKVQKLHAKFPTNVYEYSIDDYLLAFVVDIYIFFWNMSLYGLLEEKGLNFWPHHPKDTPTQDEIKLPKNLIENEDLMRFMYGKSYKDIQTRADVVRFWFGDILTEEEIIEFANTSGVELFYLNIKHSVTKKNFLESLLRLRKKSYQYHLQQIGHTPNHDNKQKYSHIVEQFMLTVD